MSDLTGLKATLPRTSAGGMLVMVVWEQCGGVKRTEEGGEGLGRFEEGFCADGIVVGLVYGNVDEALLDRVEVRATWWDARRCHGFKVSEGLDRSVCGAIEYSRVTEGEYSYDWSV